EFTSNFSAYTFSETANGLIVDGPAGHDTLHQISRMVFGGVTITDDNYGDTSTTAQITVGGSASGGLQFKGDHDWFAVQLTAGHSYAIDELGSASGGGTLSNAFVRLHDAAGNEVVHDDDNGLGLDSYLVYHVTQSGTYYVDAGASGDSATGSYTVQVQEF